MLALKGAWEKLKRAVAGREPAGPRASTLTVSNAAPRRLVARVGRAWRWGFADVICTTGSQHRAWRAAGRVGNAAMYALAVVALCGGLARAGSTVIASTSTYGGDPGVGLFAPSSNLPFAGVYVFTMKVSTGSTFSGLSVYLQQQGLSGQWYTLNASTFTSCSSACNGTVTPDVYEGGSVRPQWSVTSGSATFTITATQVAL